MRTIAAAGRLRARLDQSVDEHKLQLKKVNRELKSEIADRMLAEEALRVSEERLRALNDFAPIGILLTNIEGECIYANAEWQAISGLNLEESLGGGWMQSIHPEAREVVLGGLSASSKEELKFVHECRLVDSEGGEHWVCFRSAAMHSDSGDLTGHVGTVVDLTERKRAEEELKRQEDMLLQSEKLAAIGELASGVAHELNQPLNHINITCQLIGKMLSRGIRETDDLPAELSVIEENIQRAAAIVRGMREFSRKEISGNEPIDVRKAIENAVMMFGSQLRTKNIKLSIDAPDHPVVAIGSTNRLGQVLVNLITNARDALEECDDGRRKEISIGVREGEQAVEISVADNGAGIPESVISQIFNPFFTTKEAGKGTGLGMSISHKIIRDFGGALEVESETGVGTKMTITLQKVLAAVAGGAVNA